MFNEGCQGSGGYSELLLMLLYSGKLLFSAVINYDKFNTFNASDNRLLTFCVLLLTLKL